MCSLVLSWLCDKKIVWRVDRVTRCRCDEMTMWWVDRVTRCRCDEMTMWRVDCVTRCRCDEMTMWWVDRVTRCRCDEMTVWRVDCVTSWLIAQSTNALFCCLRRLHSHSHYFRCITACLKFRKLCLQNSVILVFVNVWNFQNFHFLEFWNCSHYMWACIR